jgi:predicted ATPase
VLYHQGAYARALAHLDQAAAAYDRLQHALYLRRVGDDPVASSMILAASLSWFLGYPQQARRRIAAGMALAEELGHPFTSVQAQLWSAVTHIYLRDCVAVRSHAAALIQLCHKHDFHYQLGLGTCLDGWALAMQGDAAAGIAQIQRGLALWSATGAHRPRHAYLALLAEAYGHAGDYAQGLHIVEQGLAAISSVGGVLEAELYRLRGEFLMHQAAAAAPAADELLAQAEAALRKALAIAQARDAKSFELRASMSLSRLWQRQGKPAAAEQLLAGIYRWFTEGLDTPDLQDAQRLLTTLRTDAV